MSNETSAARAVAPEDIRRGDVIAVLRVQKETIPFLMSEDFRPGQRQIKPARA